MSDKKWSIEDPTPEDLAGGTTLSEGYNNAHGAEVLEDAVSEGESV